MKVGIMQPYFFPYIGYWQLIQAVDVFVIYDDVTFIKSGWINRNCILERGRRVFFTLETQGASSNRLINQVNVGRNSKKLVKTLYQNYHMAPYFQKVNPLFTEILLNEEKNLAKFLTMAIRKICSALNMTTKILVASEFLHNQSLNGESRVINICELLGADAYINAIGGKDLYHHDAFERKNIQLRFLNPKIEVYKQFQEKFVPSLSIIDVLMFNPIKKTKTMLQSFELVL